MEQTDLKNFFLSLVRYGIGHSPYTLPKIANWVSIQDLANKQGLSAIVIDGIERVPDRLRPPQMLLLQWIGEVMQNYEARYRSYKNAIAKLADFYTRHGFKMMVMKGYACSLDWPKPEHRPCGDIDIWLFGRQQEADKALLNSSRIGELEYKVTIDSSHHHHTVFEWNGFTIENHYDFVNIHAHKSSKELEVVFKELGQDDTHFVEMADASTGSATKVYLPSPNLHALFLIKHMVSHFAAAEITLRQVLDWAFFVEKHTKEIDWEWLLGLLEEYHMKDFFNLINAICVEDLGFSADIFPSVHFLPSLKERVLADILSPEWTAVTPKELPQRIVYKCRRWQGNAWKQRLCYNESRICMFWSGLINHLLKPRSI